jgi:crotonobetainyl-CoA:carnitine CoA-transferase CaiB-like acyl-CoA transferase
MPDDTPALSDVRVLDLSEGIAGPFCCKLLAGLGAEVVKVERPVSGDISRGAPPFIGDDPDREKSLSFLYLNTGKKSVTLNLQSEAGAEILKRLSQEYDILVESFPPGLMREWALDYSSLEVLHPGLIYTSITPFGQSGPYRDYQGSDLVAQALSGLMDTVGLPDREPLKVPGNAALYTTGVSAFSATMLALYSRDINGYGQHVDVSVMETMTVAQIRASIHQQFGGAYQRRPSALVPAKDGWVSPGLETGVREDIWGQVCQLMGVPELAQDPNFNTREARREHQKEVLEVVGRWAASQPKEEIYHTLQGMRTIAGYVATAEDLFASAQLQSRQFFQPVDDPRARETLYPGAPFGIGDVPWRQAAAPYLGQHTAEVLCGQLGYREEDLEGLRRQGVI